MAVHTERYLTREQQFCVWCKAESKGWVRVISMAELADLRHGRNERAARAAYFARRRRRTARHYAEVHPEVILA